MKKRISVIFLSLLMIVSSLVSCSNNKADTRSSGKVDKRESQAVDIGYADGYYYYCEQYFNSDTDVNDTLNRISEDGTKFEIVLEEDVESMNFLGDWIYYINGDDKKVYKVKLDGSDKSLVLDKRVSMLSIKNGYLYCKDYEDQRIFRASLKGAKEETLIEKVDEFIIDGNYMYYSLKGEFKRADLSGKNEQTIHDFGIDGSIVKATLEFVKDDYIYFDENLLGKGSINNLSRMKVDGSDKQKLANNHMRMFDIKDDYLYYRYTGSNDTLSRVELTESGVMSTYDSEISSQRLPSRPTIINDKIIFSSKTILGDELYMIDLDGSNKKVILNSSLKKENSRFVELYGE